MKYCDDYAALLDQYVDGELSPGDMAAVQAHLDECPGCRAYVDDALALRAAFPGVEDTEVPAGFSAGVMAAIQAAPRQKKAVSKKSPWPRLLAPLAACCAVVLLIRGVGFGGAEKAESAADTAANMTTEAPRMEAPASAPLEEEDTTFAALSIAPTAEAQYDSTASKNASEPMCRASSLYFAILTLPADALEIPLLADSTPTGTEDGGQRYELPSEDYDALLDELDAAGIQPLVQEQTNTDSETALIIIASQP